jgi:ferredoxin
MAHLATRSGYARLVDRLNRFPQGAPPGETLNKILRLLFSKREAELVADLPIKPFTASDAARVWKQPEHEARHTLERLAGRGILLDIDDRGSSVYVLPPPMAGFFEFSMMRVREDVDQKVLAELFYQYLNVEEDFIKSLFTRGETQLGRVFVHEPAIPSELAVEVLDYERASEVIRTAAHRAVSLCYCRHKMAHLDRACAAPLDICMTFNNTAASLIKHGIARAVDEREGLDMLQAAGDRGLVQFGENARTRVNFICNCCGCCCEAMIAARRFGFLNPVHTTNFIPRIDTESCNGCGKCVDACPVEALGLVSANDAARRRRKTVRLDDRVCLGCGICVKACDKQSIRLDSRERRVITPLDSSHRTIVMAIERGTLHDLIFDNQALWSHRAMAAILGVVLRLPPLQRALASRQVKSRYLEHLVERWEGTRV